ncbi:hypothetical protein FUSO4_01200 [Fusobacterium necrophorum DJ-1]|uniref:Lipoprotein n=2 Tax=Fusobacterium necrophorum TaxID=859 RepID=A0AB73BYJ3_9FUSO|nr:hypothetical protein FUSO5_11290 [Fusobacterium necrophorum BFTR-1]KDE65123.1 hypothetical protein FUSO3_01725 [Fusobacterium necrophorum BL]KDE68110.1 hypothetical protein FUSO4_01200 [Fusobacterium necrophorum DJ-1]KDE69294.1 hypothetical protein FUSO8_11870 [Fusobacterium necrophorum DJ-2]KDE71557.1 hypothetical protein FUSO6_00210 [Fusobacterium necrophorum DAB]KDE74851.1 hypothetical protein FUSO7_00690 [Fusobacterium necrophorum BFTR-2]
MGNRKYILWMSCFLKVSCENKRNIGKKVDIFLNRLYT